MSTIEPYRGGPVSQDVTELAERPETPRKPDNIDLAWLFSAFRRRMGLFVLTVVATILAVFVFCIVFPPQYTATARVTINERTLAPTPYNQAPVVGQLPAQSPDVDTETQVIQSRRVAGRVVDALRLDRDPEFSSNKVSLKQALVNFVLWFFHPSKFESPRDRVIDAVLANLDPERYLLTNAIDINFKDNNPAKAQRIANAFAQAYLDDQVEAKARQNRLATDALESQIETMRRQAASDADKVQAYRVAHNLMTVGITSGAQTLTQDLIGNYQQAVTQAKVEEAAAEASLHAAQLQLAQGSNGDNLGASLNSGVVSSLRAQRAVVSGKLADLQAHYGPKYPDLKQAREQLHDIDQEIQGENLRIISNLAVAVDVSKKRLASIQGTLDAAKATLAQDNIAMAGLESLTRTAAVSQALYEAYLDRFKQSVAQAGSQTPDAEIVSVAGLPSDPSFPIIWLFLPLGVVAGVLFGCSAVLIAELLETRMATAEDVELRLGRPYLGGIPQLSSVIRGGGLSPLDAIVGAPHSAYSEAFRGLLASINLAAPNDGSGVIVVTSALPREGKTTVAAGLARTSALQGLSTILIDCDLRRRGLTRAFRLDDGLPGLLEVLRGEATLEQALSIDKSTGLRVLGLRANPSVGDEWLGGEAMDRLLGELRALRHAVIIDAPALPIAVSRRLSAKATATVIVAQWRNTSEAGLRAALRLLSPEHALLVGVALNRIDMAQQAKYGLGNPGHFYQKFKQYYA